MLCAESGCEDKRSNIYSHFGVIEQIRVRKLPEPLPGTVILVPTLQFQAVAVWERAETDGPDQEFEYRFVFHLPPGEEEVVAGSGTFKFATQRYRLVLNAGGALFKDVGLFRVDCKIRPVGAADDAWVSQGYSFLVTQASP
jgi:hypothetical protein